MLRKKEISRIKENIKNDNTLVVLEEVGEINIDYISEDLELFIEALEEVTKKQYTIIQKIGKKVIVEY